VPNLKKPSQTGLNQFLSKKTELNQNQPIKPVLIFNFLNFNLFFLIKTKPNKKIITRELTLILIYTTAQFNFSF
jgi:hypothetical protein